MPTYEYKCTKEGSKFELWQEVGSEAPPCPTCGAPSKKVFGAPRVHFKGSGFYLTDLRAEQAGSKGVKSEGEAPSEAKVEAKTESASETKSESSAPVAAPAVSAPATPASDSSK